MTVVASRYARALIEALGGENTAGPDAGLEQLGQIKLLLGNEPDARKLLINPVIPPERRDSFVDEISRVLGLDARVAKLLHLIVERRRLEILDDLIDAYRKMLDEKKRHCPGGGPLGRSVIGGAAAGSRREVRGVARPACCYGSRRRSFLDRRPDRSGRKYGLRWITAPAVGRFQGTFDGGLKSGCPFLIL